MHMLKHLRIYYNFFPELKCILASFSILTNYRASIDQIVTQKEFAFK